MHHFTVGVSILDLIYFKHILLVCEELQLADLEKKGISRSVYQNKIEAKGVTPFAKTARLD